MPVITGVFFEIENCPEFSLGGELDKLHASVTSREIMGTERDAPGLGLGIQCMSIPRKLFLAISLERRSVFRDVRITA